MSKTIIEIVREYLEKNGYGGLWDDDCCCEVSDLMPCGLERPDCKAGHKISCDCGEGCEWHIGEKEGV